MEGIQLGAVGKRSFDSEEMEFVLESDVEDNSKITPARTPLKPGSGSAGGPRRLTKDDASKNNSQRSSEDYGIADISSQSAYTPLSYAAYAQNMFNYGGIGGIPTPLTREILSFVERVDAVGAKMQR